MIPLLMLSLFRCSGSFRKYWVGRPVKSRRTRLISLADENCDLAKTLTSSIGANNDVEKLAMQDATADSMLPEASALSVFQICDSNGGTRYVIDVLAQWGEEDGELWVASPFIDENITAINAFSSCAQERGKHVKIILSHGVRASVGSKSACCLLAFGSGYSRIARAVATLPPPLFFVQLYCTFVKLASNIALATKRGNSTLYQFSSKKNNETKQHGRHIKRSTCYSKTITTEVRSPFGSNSFYASTTCR